MSAATAEPPVATAQQYVSVDSAGAAVDGNIVDDMEPAPEERDLAEDARWKLIQRNTFTRWANEHLRSVDMFIDNLETDLSDGLRLIALVEVLSGKRLPYGYSKKPAFRSQRLENVSVVLKFLEEDEHIKLVNIDSSDIVDCKLKLILGLIWTLILHYSITMPMWGDGDYNRAPQEKGLSPKQRLLNWIKNKLPDGVPVSNFTTDWNDGRAVGALVDAVAPGLCPNWADWKKGPKEEALKNAKEAMDLADKWLGVKQLIKPEELVGGADEQSMMTYLSQYPSAKLKQGAPIRPRTSRIAARVFGPGVEPTGPVAGQQTYFTIDTEGSNDKGNVEVVVENPQGKREPVNVVPNNNGRIYTVTYTPLMSGPYTVQVKHASANAARSPYRVQVAEPVGNPTKVKAFGPGLQPEGVLVAKPTYFEIHTKDAGGKGVPEVIILDPAGRENTVHAKITKQADGVYKCDYTAIAQGVHSINIFYDKQPIPHSPFTVLTSNASDARKVRCFGRGLQSRGVRVGDDAKFKILTDGAGEGVPEVNVIGPGGIKEPVQMKKSTDEHTYDVMYHPRKPGRHVVMVTFAGQEVPKSPFEVHVMPYKETLIRAYGPGLTGGVVSYPAVFTVDTNGETGALGFSIEGPSKAKINCNDNGDGSADVQYYPTAPGEYAVHVLCDEEDIPGSPFMAYIVPAPNTDFHPERVKCYGDGIHPNGVEQGQRTQFTVDTRKAGTKAPLDVKIYDNAGHLAAEPIMVRDNKDGTFACEYVPTAAPGKHTIQVAYGDVAVPESPFRVPVSQPVDANQVRVFGPGVAKTGIKSNVPTHFTVDCSNAGIGELNVNLVDNRGVDVPLKVSENDDGSFRIEYVPPAPGTYKLRCTYGGAPVPGCCPIEIMASKPPVDASKVRVDGLETVAAVNSVQEFRVWTLDACPGAAELAVMITGPSGGSVKAYIVPVDGGGYAVSFTPIESGEYQLSITVAGETVVRQHRVRCVPAAGDPSKVSAYGPGLNRGRVDWPAQFTVDTRKAGGRGGLAVTVEGPCETAIACRDNGDGTCAVAYTPRMPGDYAVNVTFDDQPIPGSPFNALVLGNPAPNVKVSGNGIQPYGVFLDSPADFIVDCRAVNTSSLGKGLPGIVTCTVTNPSGARTDTLVAPQGDGTYRISYTPFEEGPHTVEIFYDGAPVVGSPFTVNVKRGTDASKCRAHGLGLTKGILNSINSFTVETRGAGTGSLGLAIEGPSEAKMTCRDNRDGTCSVDYIPTEPGEYDISIKYAEKHIPGSPFKIGVDRIVDANKVIVTGHGLNSKYCRDDTPATFKVDATQSARGHLDVKMTTDRGPLKQRPIVNDKEDGTYEVTFTPGPEGALLTANVLYNGVPVPNSPFKVRVRPKFELDKVKIQGPGVSDGGVGVKASVPTYFVVDATEAGTGKLDVRIVGPDGYPRHVDVDKVDQNLYKCKYTPDDCGNYSIEALYGGTRLPGTPIAVQCHPTGNANMCRIVGTGTASMSNGGQVVPIGKPQTIVVEASGCGLGNVTCRIKPVDGDLYEDDVSVVPRSDGAYDVHYTVRVPGVYQVSLKFGGRTVPKGEYIFTAIKS